VTALTTTQPGPLLPTDARPGETPEECVEWFAWCKGVVELDTALAARNAWTQRRNQLEGMAGLASDPRERLTQALFSELDVVAIASKQHLLNALENPDRAARDVSTKDAVELLLKAANTPAPEKVSQITDLLLNAPPEIKEKALAVQTWIASQLGT
jgi:hypothetical protein